MFKHADRVLVHNRTRMDHAFEGRTGTFFEYATNGYARLHLDGDPSTATVLVHPESVEHLAPCGCSSLDPRSGCDYIKRVLEKQEAFKCDRCGEQHELKICKAEGCDPHPHLVCPGWSGMCCYGGSEFAKGQM